jgi:hypothetical protein
VLISWQSGGRDGCWPRYFLRDREMTLLFVLTPKWWEMLVTIQPPTSRDNNGTCFTDRPQEHLPKKFDDRQVDEFTSSTERHTRTPVHLTSATS